ELRRNQGNEGMSQHQPYGLNDPSCLRRNHHRQGRITYPSHRYGVMERIIKKRTKNEAKSTKPDSEWKSKEKTKSKSKPKPEKSTQVNPDKSKSQHVKKYKFKG
ncbi:hypothetical protein Tco_0648536, partial [Tanacetum coccineum]